MQLRHTLLAASFVAVFFLGWNAVLERVAHRIEVRTDACLWGNFDEHRQLLIPSNYEDLGRGRILALGPSESREGILHAELATAIEGYRYVDNSQSMGTLSSFRLTLEYIDRAYGEGALPEAVVLGLSPRVVCNIGNEFSPVFEMLRDYSPDYGVDPEALRLEPKSAAAGWLARVRFLGQKSLRYRMMLRVLLQLGPNALFGETAPKARAPLVAARYHHKPRHEADMVQARIDPAESSFKQVAGWDYEADAGGARPELAAIRAFCEQRGIELLCVQLPERSICRELWAPGQRAAYDRLIASALDTIPVLDLRELLTDEEYFDVCHPNRSGAERITAELVRFIAQHLAEPGPLAAEPAGSANERDHQ